MKMDTIPESYELETIEQLRAAADELRLRVIEQLALQAMTVTQLAELLGEAPNRLHYHVRELERVGLLKKVETREKGAILEKYYRTVAKNITIPRTLLSSMAPDEVAAMLNEVVQPFFQGFTRAAEQLMHIPTEDQPDYVFQISPGHFWMTREEMVGVSEQIAALLKPYEERRDREGEREQTILWLAYPTALSGVQEDADAMVQRSDPARPLKQELLLQAGFVRYTRQDLEKHLAQGGTLNMYMLGTCTFADDVSPDLVERAIVGFHLKGKLNASPEVREVLKRKGGEAGKQNT